VRSYLYAADLAVWLWTILLRTPAGAARAWNIGSEEPVSIRQLAGMVANFVTPPLPVEVLGRPVAGQPPQIYLPDTTRARQELGLGQSVALPAALARTLAWMKASEGPAA
jgi:dTDP-glucose 4,6-dehydratase